MSALMNNKLFYVVIGILIATFITIIPSTIKRVV